MRNHLRVEYSPLKEISTYKQLQFSLLKNCLPKNEAWPVSVAHAYYPSTLGGRGGWITKSRDRDPPGQQGETLSLLKIQKLAGHGGACL